MITLKVAKNTICMSEIFKENGTKTSPFAIARYNKNFEYPYINASLALN